MSQETVVLVVGAGPVGLFMANELTRHGVPCKIIDKKTGHSTQSKALGIHIRTLLMFQQTGFFEDVLSQGHKVHGALFFANGKTLIDFTFDGLDARLNYLIDLPQDQTETILEQHLQQKGLQVSWQTELLNVQQNPEGVQATLKGVDGQTQTLNTNWVIACDGSHSTLRHLYNIEFVGSPYKEHWWLADVYIDWQLPNDRMIVFLTKLGPLAAFPMQNKRYRLVMAAPPEGPVNPTFSDIQAYMQKYCTTPASLSNPLWITGFDIHHRQIQQYQHGRVFFAGDAAHIHSPMGGQGMNTGLQDVYNLAWKLAMVYHGYAKPQLLDSYHPERHPVGKKVLHDTDRMTRMVTLKNPLLIALRNRLVPWLSAKPKIRREIANSLAELSIHYQDSPIVAQHGKLAINPGQFVPPLPLNSAGQQTLTLQQLTTGTKHHLMIWLCNNTDLTQASELARDIMAHYAAWIQVHLVCAQPTNLDGAPIWHDPHLTAHRALGITQPSLLLIRPDQYVGYVQTSLDSAPLLAYLQKIYG